MTQLGNMLVQYMNA